MDDQTTLGIPQWVLILIYFGTIFLILGGMFAYHWVPALYYRLLRTPHEFPSDSEWRLLTREASPKYCVEHLQYNWMTSRMEKVWVQMEVFYTRRGAIGWTYRKLIRLERETWRDG